MIGFQPIKTFQLLAESENVDRANTLLIASCEAFLFQNMPLQSEIEQFEVLAQRLFLIASAEIRKDAALLLKQSENLTPLMEQLIIANIDSEIDDYLNLAKNISEQTLNMLISKKDIEISATIAKRPNLTNPILSSLFKTNSRKVYQSLAANKNIEPKGLYLNAFARSAQLDFQIAQSLAKRQDFDAALLVPVFFDLDERDRIKVIEAFAKRKTPSIKIKKTIEQISVANDELTQALMRLYTENRRPEVASLLSQITGLSDMKCAQIAHDVSGAALFVVLRGFGCSAYDGLRVIIHATSHDEDRSQVLADFARLFQNVEIDAMVYMMSAWRGEVNLLDLAKPEYIRADRTRKTIKTIEQELEKVKTDRPAHQAIKALSNIGARSA